MGKPGRDRNAGDRMEILTANQRGGDARESLNFSGFNLMKAYIAGCRHYSKKLMTRNPRDVWGKRQGLAQ
jgi:hypothetical protein